MAKRKAAGTPRRKAAPARGGTRRTRAAGRKTANRKVTKKIIRKKTGAAARKRSSAAPKAARRARERRTARTVRTRAVKKAIATRKAVARTRVVPKAVVRKAVARKAGGLETPRVPRTTTRASTRRVPALDRARRMVQGDDIVSSPPSSLNMDRTASAVRSGRKELRARLGEHTETSPVLTAGDIDADWESAYSVGDEAPGGDNPTPDQDVVDDIGKAVGVQYEDNEELKGEAKILKRDKHRWELDPASAEDYDDR